MVHWYCVPLRGEGQYLDSLQMNMIKLKPYPIIRRPVMYILTYRYSLFGDFNRFTPTTSSIIEWSQTLQNKGYDFLPNIINSQPPALSFLPVQPLPQDKRVQFTSPQGDITARILANRVDVECNFLEGDDPESILAGKTSKVGDIMKTLLFALEDAKGVRVAYYVDAFLPENSPGSIVKKCADYNLGLSIKEFVDCTEWGHRFNSRVKLQAGQAEEVCNAIFFIESSVLNTHNNTSGQNSELKGLHLSADINTLAEKMDVRFDADSLIQFCSNAQVFFFDMYKQIKAKFVY